LALFGLSACEGRFGSSMSIFFICSKNRKLPAPRYSSRNRAKIGQFAEEYGFHLAYYKLGLCAIFEKES
jgi:hypothetical protein